MMRVVVERIVDPPKRLVVILSCNWIISCLLHCDVFEVCRSLTAIWPNADWIENDVFCATQ